MKSTETTIEPEVIKFWLVDGTPEAAKKLFKYMRELGIEKIPINLTLDKDGLKMYFKDGSSFIRSISCVLRYPSEETANTASKSI